MTHARHAVALATILVVGLAARGAAQAPGGTPAPAVPPQYEVEVIVFAQRDIDPTEERFERAPPSLLDGALAPALAVPLFDATALQPPPMPSTTLPTPTAPGTAPAEDPRLVRVLRPEELKLGNEYRKLSAIAAYVPLLHAGWVQPGLPENEAVPFDLGTLGVVNPRGTVRVHLSRFLHITLDLTFTGQPSPAEASVAADALGEIDVAPSYRLATTRSARSGELHYFDHPAFGVLVRVTPRASAVGPTGRRPAA